MKTNREKLYALGTLLFILGSIAAFQASCSEHESKQRKARDAKYLYRVTDGKNYVGGLHEDLECSTLKAALRKWPALSVERFLKENVYQDLEFCSCVSDKTYEEAMKMKHED